MLTFDSLQVSPQAIQPWPSTGRCLVRLHCSFHEFSSSKDSSSPKAYLVEWWMTTWLLSLGIVRFVGNSRCVEPCHFGASPWYSGAHTSGTKLVFSFSIHKYKKTCICTIQKTALFEGITWFLGEENSRHSANNTDQPSPMDTDDLTEEMLLSPLHERLLPDSNFQNFCQSLETQRRLRPEHSIALTQIWMSHVSCLSVKTDVRPCLLILS